MKKLLNNPWFVSALAIAALALVAHSLLSGGNASAGGPAPIAADEPAVAEPEVSGEVVALLPVEEALKALELPKHAMRDPFARRRVEEDNVVEKAAIPDLIDAVHLSALWTQSGVTYSLINDRICQTGDVIGRIRLESATPEGIWLSHWKGRDFVVLGGEFTLRTPAGHSAL